MPTFYCSITMLQEPMDFGLDADKNPRFAFNVLCDKYPSDTFGGEIIAILTAAGVGTYGTNIFIGSKATRPVGMKGAVLMVAESGGGSPDMIHNQAAPAYRKPTAQFVASAEKPADARRMAFLAWNALSVVRNASVTPIALSV
jgi:hypothetical protein